MEAIRSRLSELVATAGEAPSAAQGEEYRELVKQFIALGGSQNDLVVKIGAQFFTPKARSLGPQEDEPLPGSVRIPFEYLETFMIDSFLAIGVPDREARICADVLIESDKRGIDSHGVGRLKPIYFDRIKKGILKPFAPIDILKETDTTAMVCFL